MVSSNFILYNMISREEKILWRGKPNFKCFILEAIFNPLLIIALIWGAIDFACLGHIVLVDMPTMAAKGHSGPPFIVMIAFFALHLMPVWIYLTGALFSFLEYKRTEYVITNKGVYCSGGMFSQSF